MLSVNPNAGIEAIAAGAPHGDLTNVKLPEGGFLPGYFYARSVLFAADVTAGAKAAAAVLLDTTLVANVKDAFLRQVLGFAANDPSLLCRIYAYKLHITTSSVAASVPPTEGNQALLLEDIILVSGNNTKNKSVSLGMSVGSAFPNKGTTRNNADIGSRLPSWRAVPFNGDVVNFQNELLELRCLQGITTEAMRLQLEIAAEWVVSGSADWARGPCVNPNQVGPWKARFKALYPAVYAECYPMERV